jgi:hydroxyethylthiazole kinase
MHDPQGGRSHGAGRAGAPAADLADLPALTADVLDRLRQRRPRVHCITNAVAQAFTANLLLAAGAVPSMTIAPDEVAHFVAGADALLVNLGTFDAERRQAGGIAIEAAVGKGLPWVLDPVFVDRSQPRAAYARELVGKGPRSIRLNRGEFLALAGIEPEAVTLLRYARDQRITIGLTGATDRVTDGARLVTIANGHPLMSRVTAMGCAGSALVAACLAVADDAFTATAAALIMLGVAGEIAAEGARGPGTLAAAIIDALYNLDRDELCARARVT